MEENSPQKRLVPIIGGVLFILLIGTYFVFQTMKTTQKPIPKPQEKMVAVPTIYGKNAEVRNSKYSQITSTEELNDIVVAVIDYALATGNQDPDIEILSNDGEYASARLAEGGVNGSTTVFLAKRENRWIVVHNGNGMPSCKEFMPKRETYALPADFVVCAEEL